VKSLRLIELGIGDDAALLVPTKNREIVLTCDWFLEGQHFLPDKHPADSVGWKCLARAASDIAAMGGEPRCFLLSLALPDKLTGTWLADFLVGLRRVSRQLDCALAGGDTTRSERVLIHVSVIGEIRPGVAARRSGARPGDLLYVSGRLGEAEAGLQILKTGSKKVRRGDQRLEKHFYPVPRIGLGRWLAETRIASAMMDLSDGLSSDLRRMCKASGGGARIQASQLPLSPLAPAAERLKMALHGGDDYELLFAVPKARAADLPRSFKGIPLTCIGEFTANRTVLMVGTDGNVKPLEAHGWDPFR
jgi:thiamine-monophosphate kinase